LFFVPPFWPHAITSTPADAKRRDDEHVAVHFDFRADVPPRGKDPSRRPPYRVRLAGGLRIPRVHRCRPHDDVYTAMVAIAQARSRADAAGPISTIEQRGCLLRVIAKLLQVPARSAADDDDGDDAQPVADRRNAARIERAIAEMRVHFASAFDAETLARAAGLSPSHFTRLFREYTGYAPMQYLRHRRIDAARALLANVDLSVKEIAARCGFDDPYHFSKVFHQIDGLPPTEYREAVLAGRR
jgi:AraC-like DNA-binding protein